MIMFVYCIENILDGKKYIGITTGTLERRFREHKSSAKNPSDSNHCHLQAAMHKYGIENFKIYSIAIVETKSELFENEKYWIKTLNTKKNGYNETDGGEGFLGGKLSEEHKAKLRGRIVSEDTRQKIKEARKHQTFSEKTREKFRQNALGNKRALGNRFNVIHSPEHCAKISAAKKGKPGNENQKKAVTKNNIINNPMNNEKSRQKVGLSKIGRKRIYREDGSFYMTQKEGVPSL